MLAALWRAIESVIGAEFGDSATAIGEVVGDVNERVARDGHATRCPKLRHLVAWEARHGRFLWKVAKAEGFFD